MKNASFDLSILKYAGLMGHTFCAIGSDPTHGDRKLLGEFDMLADASYHFSRGYTDVVVYSRVGRTWTPVQIEHS